MSSPPLETAIGDVESKNHDAKVDDEKFAEKAKATRDAAAKMIQTIDASPPLAGIPVSDYVALHAAYNRTVAALKVEKASYTDEEKTSIKKELDACQAAATRIKEKAAALRSAWKPAPLLSESGRGWVGGGAVLMFVLGALCATIGIGKSWPAATTLSYWCAFASFILATIWVFASVTVRGVSFSAMGMAKSGSDLQYLIFGGMAFLVLGLLVAGVMTGGLLEFLSSVPGARGLITFLIAIGTIAIAVILTLASIIMEADNEEILKERLSKGKEILTVLVGVLGTIVGFYFASNTDGSGGGKITVAIVSAPKSVAPGDAFSVLAMTTGGELPYDPAAILTVGDGVTGKASANEQGVITAELKVAEGVKPGAIPLVLGIRDKSGKTATAKSDINVVAGAKK